MPVKNETRRSMVIAMCGVQLKDRAKDLMLMFVLNEAIDGMALQTVRVFMMRYCGENSLHLNRMCVCDLSRREDGHVLIWALELEVEGQRKKRRPKRMWKKQVEDKSMKVCLIREDALCQSKWIVGVYHIATRLKCVQLP